MSYKKYISKNKPIQKFDLGGIYFPYGTTTLDPRNPMHYYAIDYVPLPYMPYDLESELELLKSPTTFKPNLDFGKLKEKLDKNLLPAEKDAIFSQFDKLVREATQIATFNPYANFDQNFIELNHKINEFVHSSLLQRAIDNKKNFDDISQNLSKKAESYSIDSSGIPLPVTNGQVVNMYRQTKFDENPLYSSIARADSRDGITMVNNTSFDVPDEKDFYEWLDKVTNTSKNATIRGTERGVYAIGNSFLNFTPVIHTRSGYDKEIEHNFQQLSDVRIKILNAFQNSKDLDDLEKNLLTITNGDVVSSFKSNLQKTKRFIAKDMQEYAQLALGMKNKRNEEIENAKKELENILKTEPDNEELKKKKAYLEGLVLNENRADVFKFNNLQNAIKTIETSNKQYSKQLLNLLSKEDPLKLQYAIRAIKKDPQYIANHISSSPFLLALYQVSSPKVFSSVVENLYDSLEAMDVFVGTNIFSNTIDLFRLQKQSLVDKFKDKSIQELSLYRDGGGGANKEHLIYNSEAYNILMGAGTEMRDEHKVMDSIQDITYMFGITAKDIDDDATTQGRVAVYRKDVGLSKELKDRIMSSSIETTQNGIKVKGFVPNANVGDIYITLENGERLKIDANSFPKDKVIAVSDVSKASITSLRLKDGNIVSLPFIKGVLGEDAKKANDFKVKAINSKGETVDINLRKAVDIQMRVNNVTQYNISKAIHTTKEAFNANDDPNVGFVELIKHQVQDSDTELQQPRQYNNLLGGVSGVRQITPASSNKKINKGLGKQ